MLVKRTLAAGAILLASAVAANATDITPIIPAPPPPAAPPPPPAFNWAGPYVGVMAGYGWGDTIWEMTAFGGGPATDWGPGTTQSWPISGWLAGAFAGYNAQFSSIVLGAEVGLNWTNITGTATSAFGAGDDVMTTTIRNLVTAVARIGFAANNWLIYARGGYAGGQVTGEWEDTGAPNTGTWGPSTVWHHGFQIGGGVEVGLSHNLVLGLEYNFTRLLSAAHTANEEPAGLPNTYEIGAQFHTVGVRLSILFGGP